MRKLIEFTLLSADGVFEGPNVMGFSEFRDDAYMRDGLSQALNCEAMLMGRNTYEAFKNIWPKRTDAWAKRINEMRKYVFSAKQDRVEWENTILVRDDAVMTVSKLKEQEGQDPLIYGHGLLVETLMRHSLIDVIDLAIHPVIAGRGRLLYREGVNAKMKVAAVKSYSKGIVKITYEPQT